MRKGDEGMRDARSMSLNLETMIRKMHSPHSPGPFLVSKSSSPFFLLLFHKCPQPLQQLTSYHSNKTYSSSTTKVPTATVIVSPPFLTLFFCQDFWSQQDLGSKVPSQTTYQLGGLGQFTFLVESWFIHLWKRDFFFLFIWKIIKNKYDSCRVNIMKI